MKKSLKDYTVDEFVAILSREQETDSEDARSLLSEYLEIADPSGRKNYFYEIEEKIKSQLEITMFKVCFNLMSVRAYDSVREILQEYGMNIVSEDVSRLMAQIESGLHRAKKRYAELRDKADKEDIAPESIHLRFDEQTAALMAYYKFQIDTATMRATVYAHLIARHTKEIKEKLAAIKSR